MGNKCFKVKRATREKQGRINENHISNIKNTPEGGDSENKLKIGNKYKNLNLESLLSDEKNNNSIIFDNIDKEDPINPIRNSYLQYSQIAKKRNSPSTSELNEIKVYMDGNLKTLNTNNTNQVKIGQNNNILQKNNNFNLPNSNNLYIVDYENNYLAKLFTQNNISFFNPNSEKIEDCYTLIRKLGNGAFGRCNLAQLIKGNKEIRYAIKTIEFDSIDKDKLLLLKTEISCLKRLVHPNIVHFFQLFYDESNLHMVMEPCMNGSLFDKIIEKGSFSEKETIKIIITLLSAINYCHKNKIIHRDIKPENILLVNPVKSSKNTSSFQETMEWEYDLRLIDFGLSHIYSKIDLNSLLCSSVGSPYFMAPEVLNECYNSKCDIWSLGVLFYFLIAGVPPFYSDSIPDLFKLILQTQPNFQSEVWKDISKETKDAITIMLIKDFRQRPSCQDLLRLPCFRTEILNLQNDEKLVKYETLINWLYEYLKRKNNFIREISNAMSHQLCTSDFKTASCLFKIIDKDFDGNASTDPLIKFLKEKQVDVSHFMQIKTILYSDIIEAITFKKFHNEDFFLHTFETFDIDTDKHINLNDLSTCIFKNATKITQLEIDIILKDVGLSKNFKLNIDEFREKVIK